jgi:hypothetical protein
LKEIILDTCTDALKLLPFLFLTYLAMEYIEHKAGTKMKHAIQRSGRLGPLWGSLLGVIPQCGFSAAASSLYAGRVITLGTLIAVYLSTSDEMLPILISEQAAPDVIFKILGVKIIAGMAGGFLTELVMYIASHGSDEEEIQISEKICHGHCHCEDSIIRSALKHTFEIMIYIFLITFALNAAVGMLGTEFLSDAVFRRPVVGEILSALIGLIPNCGASVAITQLYLKGVMSTGAMLSGLMTSAGVGLLVLFRVNRPHSDNIKIVGILYALGTVMGIIIDLAGLVI